MTPFTLFNYKGFEILVRQMKTKYQIGIRSKEGTEMWIESIIYDSPQIAITSGRDYARIIIDKMLLSKRK